MDETRRTVIVTGAGNGIGRAVALEAARDGWAVIACDVDDQALESLRECEEISGGRDHVVLRTDVTRATEVSALFDTLSSSSHDTIALVNNAGVYLGRALTEYAPHEIEQVLRVNVVGAILCTAALAAACDGRRVSGVIVNVGSVASQAGGADPVYAASKAAITGLTRSSALMLGPRIRVNEIALGVVDTRMMTTVPRERLAHYRQTELIQEPIRPVDAARTIRFLLSSDAQHFSGATFDMNNGCHIR